MADSPVTPAEIQSTVPDPTSSLCGNFINALLKLPALIYKIFRAWLDDAGNFTQSFLRGIQKTGTYEFSACELTETYRLLCDGRAVSREDYDTLFAAIGTTYGPGDGSTTFNLPDFRDRFPVGKSVTKAGGTSGGGTVTLTDQQIPAHNHRFPVYFGSTIGYMATGAEVESGTPPGNRIVGNEGVTSPARVFTEDNTFDAAQEAVDIVPAYVACWVYIRT